MGLEFSKYFVIFEIDTLEFVKLGNVEKKQKCLNYGSKMRYFGYFLTRNLTRILSYLIWAPSNFYNCKNYKKPKMSKFGKKKKKCLIWVFWGWKLKTILSYLKQTHSDLSNCRILWKNKNPKFGTKNALFRYFRARNLKIFIIFEI